MTDFDAPNFFPFFFHALVLSNSPSYTSPPLWLNCRRTGEEREAHTRGGGRVVPAAACSARSTVCV